MNTPGNVATEASALYVGTVMHQRLRPRQHRLRYRVYCLLIDLDELPALAKRLRWFSANRFNLFSLHERDHGDGSATPLVQQVRQQLVDAGLPADGPIRLLTMPRILGHVFNPLSVYFCHAADGRLSALLYEVNNTFGQRHSYLIEVDGATQRLASGSPLTQHCDKAFYVSPFMPQVLRYRFTVTPPGADEVDVTALRIGITASDTDGAVLHAQWDTQRRTLTDAALLRVFATHPLLTLKVVAGIHWEALKMLLKGLRLLPRPPAPAHPITVIRTQDS